MNDVNLLMSRVDEINFKSADELTSNDIEVLIKYHRYQRSRRAAGEKPTKPKVNIDDIMSTLVTKATISKSTGGKSPFRGKL